MSNDKKNDEIIAANVTDTEEQSFAQVVLRKDGTIETITNDTQIRPLDTALSYVVPNDSSKKDNIDEELSEDDNASNDNNDYDDEALDDPIYNTMLPLELNAYDQVKLFLTDSKNFFNSSLIESVATAAISSSSLSSPEMQRTITDSIIIFSQICKKLIEIEKQYGKISSRSCVDEILIMGINRLSDQIIGANMPFSPYIARNIFSDVSSLPDFFGGMSLNSDVATRFNHIMDSNININLEYAKELQRDLESKFKIVDVVKSVQSYSRFLSRDASKFNNIEEFVKGFSDIVNSASSTISEVLEDDQSGLTISNVLNSSFFDTVIRTKDVHLKCGIPAFDAITNGGFEKDRVYLLSGKTGGGKSTVLLNIAYGMYKSGNGLFFPEVQLFKKFIENDKHIMQFEEYYKSIIKDLRDQDAQRFGTEIAGKKHVILYVTLENTEYETIKRFMCRMGLVSHVFWLLIDRDPMMSNLVKRKGLSFTMNDLPSIMPMKLKRRIYSMVSYIRILHEYSRTEFKVWWRPPYSITTYDIFMEVKKLEREGYIVDAVFVDYPDKMRPIQSDVSKSDQSWDTLGKIIDNLKGFSKQAALPVLAVSQLTRQGNKDSGNKNIVIKGGATAGSQQKESNTDFLINMNIHSKDDQELNNRVDLFKNYQRHINQTRSNVVGNLFIDRGNNNNQVDSNTFEYFKKLTTQAERATDILQLAFSMPDVQTISNYIVKNRDGISDMVFETYIVYGMYMVTDYDQNAVDSANYCVDTYSQILQYMVENNLVNEQSSQVCSSMCRWFTGKMNDMQRDINNIAKGLNGQSLNQLSNDKSSPSLPTMPSIAPPNFPTMKIASNLVPPTQ